MSLRRKFERKVREKEQEIQSLEYRLMEARAYLQAMQDAMKMVPLSDSGEDRETGSEPSNKPGSSRYAVVHAFRNSKRPMHIMELLTSMGREPTSENRASVGASIAAYVRKGVVFTRPAPNTFGLAEWGNVVGQDEAPPDDFGVKPTNDA